MLCRRRWKVNGMSPGIYFNVAFHEVLAVGLSKDEAFPEQDGWTKVSDNPRLGLLAVRQLLVGKGLVSDPRKVDWFGTRARPGERAA